MTACLYVSPRVERGNLKSQIVPFLMADTMATLTVSPDGAEAIIPAAAEGVSSSVRLVRKLVLMGDAAFALAGDGDRIRACVKEIEIQLPEWRELDRPLQPLGLIADKIGIRALGVLVRPEGVHHVAPRGQSRATDHLGLCAAVGSGATALLDECGAADATFARWPPQASINDKVLGFVQAVNGRRLAAELVGDKNARRSWGGYVEHAFFDFEAQAWRYGFRTVNLFCHLLEEAGGFSLVADQRAILFDPIRMIARSLAITERGMREFIFDDVRDFSAYPSESVLDFWSGWSPEVVTITAIVNHGHEQLYFPRTLTVEELKNFNIVIDRKIMKMELANSLLISICEELIFILNQ